MMDVSSTTVFLCTFVAALCIVKWLRLFSHKRFPNGPWGLPIIGHLPFFGECPPKTFQRWREKYGDVFKIRMGSWDTVVLNGYEAIKEAAESKDDSFSGRPKFLTQQILKDRNNGEDSLGFGEFNSTYLLHRKITANALRVFTHHRSKLMYELISEEANSLVEHLTMKSNGRPMSIADDLQEAVGSVIYQVLYGRGESVKEKQHLEDIVTSTNEFIEFTRSGNPFDVLPWLRYIMPGKIERFINMAQMTEYIKHNQIKKHLETYDEKNIDDITHALLAADINGKQLNASVGLTKDRIMATLTDLLGAGFETSNRTLEWMILYMSAFPDVQKRVQREIDDVIGNGRNVKIEDRTNLPFVDATIHEMMRLTSIVPFVVPHLTTKDTKLKGFDINNNTVVLFNIHSVAHDKGFWKDPENFRPERLINNKNELDLELCAHILPFGLGRRRCVGEQLAKTEIFIFFVTLLQRCTFRREDDNEKFDLNPIPGLVYRPKPYRVIVDERNSF